MPGHLPTDRFTMHRREFLRHGAVGSASMAVTMTGGSLACTTAETPPVAESTREVEPFELEEVTVDQLQASMNAGRLTARSITESYLARIEAMDQQGVALRSVLEVNPDVLTLADELDRERAGQGPRGPLHGIPVLLKDNVATADRMTTTAGSLALEGSIPAVDSGVARQLRAAGALLLGKANLSEWANFRSTRSSSGWSGRGGQCRNPYVIDRNPCGSSSGSAVAVAANLSALAIGTETDGSIVCPASANGVVGIKPTVGCVSRAGIIPIAHSQDTAGPIARTVRDAALLLGALTGIDLADSATAGSRGRATNDYTSALDPGGLRGARIGVARRFFGFHDKVDRVMDDALLTLREAGATLVDPVTWPGAPGWDEAEHEVLLYEFKADLNAYLEALGPDAPVHSLAEVIAFNERHRDREMPFFEQELFLQAEAKGPLTEARYSEALATSRRWGREAGIDQLLEAHTLDAIVAPSGGPAWTTDLVNGDRFSGGSSRPAATAGYPNISVPAGDVMGLPVGASFFAGAWSEPTLIRIAYAFEQANQSRQPPQLLPTISV